MTYQRRRKRYGKKKHYSVLNKLERENKINDQFQVMMNRLTLEEVIACKLELAGKAAGGNIYGIPVWFSIVDIVRDACLKFALTATRTKMEAARFLGINNSDFNIYIKKFDIKSYFEEETTETDSKFNS